MVLVWLTMRTRRSMYVLYDGTCGLMTQFLFPGFKFKNWMSLVVGVVSPSGARSEYTSFDVLYDGR
jgi:hypothetical protein